MVTPTFDEVAEVVAQVTGVDRSRITIGATLERDLGVTGDDGVALLDALSKTFGADFDRPDHGGRYLFHGEGFDPLSPIIRRLLGRGAVRVIPITVGDLHLAVVRGRWEDPPWPAT